MVRGWVHSREEVLSGLYFAGVSHVHPPFSRAVVVSL